MMDKESYVTGQRLMIAYFKSIFFMQNSNQCIQAPYII